MRLFVSINFSSVRSRSNRVSERIIELQKCRMEVKVKVNERTRKGL